MNRPTPKALSDWCMAQGKGDFTCSDCGTVGPYWKVQPQHPYYAGGVEGIARCTDCIDRINRAMRTARKAEMAAMERCEVDGCRMRGTFTVAGGVLMCGRHLHQAQREHARRMAGFGGMGLFMTTHHNRESILKLAGAK